MIRTKHKFTVVERIEERKFQAVQCVYIDYVPYSKSHGVIDDKLARINEGICRYKLIQDPKVMVFDSEEVKDDLSDLIKEYFGIEPKTLILHTVHEPVVTTAYICELFKKNNNKKGDIK